MINELIKHFKIFCKMCDGKYNEKVFPECRKFAFKITLEYLEAGEKLAYLSIKIISDEGDEEVFTLKDVKIYSIERISENDESGAIRYYTLRVVTNKGELYLKRDIREDKLVVEFQSNDLVYHSTVVF